MKLTRSTASNGVAVVIVAMVAAAIIRANLATPAVSPPRAASRLVGTAFGPSSSRQDLQQTIDDNRARIVRDPRDAASAVMLADALLRQARVSGNAGLATEAEAALVRVLKIDSLEYEARRMLATVYLSEHRFRDAVREAARARDQVPRDPWNYGVIGDGHIELGEYDDGFAAFQQMMDLRPSAAAYARASYAFELRGNLAAALDAMRMALDATSPRDPESLAWHHAHVGGLLLQLGRIRDARRAYQWADAAFPGHPLALIGLGRVKRREGDDAGALAIYVDLFRRSPTPDVAAEIGDIHAALGHRAEADRYYALAEAAWRVDVPEPRNLARFLADRGRNLPEAVAIAEAAAADRHDIFTEDALAWTYFKAGRLAAARVAIARALRTGSHDAMIRSHADAIAGGTALVAAK